MVTGQCLFSQQLFLEASGAVVPPTGELWEARAGVGLGTRACALRSPRAGLFSRHRLSLLERVSAEAVTTTLHQVTRERMEDRCRGEYERSFLREFHKVRTPSGLCPCGLEVSGKTDTSALETARAWRARCIRTLLVIEVVLVLGGGQSFWAHPGDSKEEPVTGLARSAQGHVAGGHTKVWGIPVGSSGASTLLGHGLGSALGCTELRKSCAQPRGASACSHFPPVPLHCSCYLSPEDAGKLCG